MLASSMAVRRILSTVTRKSHRLNINEGKRMMGSSSHGNAKDYPFGMHFHVSSVHKNLATAYGTMLWLWIFYRAKEDGLVVLGIEHPWDHGHGHGGHDDHSGHEYHGTGKYQYEKSEIGERPTLLGSVHDEDEE